MDPMTLIDSLPTKYVGAGFAVYLFAFFIVGPIAKKAGTKPDGTVTPLGRLGEWLTQDSHRPPPTFKLGLLCLLLAGPALAQDPPVPPPAPAPAFGGSFYAPRFGLVTIGPSAALTMAAYDLKTGKPTTGFKLAPGYGVNAWADKWYVTGLSGSLLIDPSSTEAPMRAGVALSFAQYVRVIWSRNALLIGLGVGP